MKWEYRYQVINADFGQNGVEKRLNELGKVGWELVSANEDFICGEIVLFFKRPLK